MDELTALNGATIWRVSARARALKREHETQNLRLSADDAGGSGSDVERSLAINERRPTWRHIEHVARIMNEEGAVDYPTEGAFQ